MIIPTRSFLKKEPRCFFFLLSGFFMTPACLKICGSAKERGASYIRFLWKKYLSVFPYHMLAFILLFVRLCIALKGISLNLVLNSLPNFLLIQRTGIKFYDINTVEWYLSAMFIAMALIIPFAVRFKGVYSRHIAPLCALLIYGWLFYKYGALGDIYEWTGFGFKCVWRAVAGLNLGMFAYECADKLSKYDFSKRERRTAIAVKYILWGVIFVFEFLRFPKEYEYVIVLMMLVALVLTVVFRNESPAVNGKAAAYLGRMSLTMYLNQIFVIVLMIEPCGKLHPVLIVLVAFVCDFALSALTLYLGDKILKAWKKGRLNKIIMNDEL